MPMNRAAWTALRPLLAVALLACLIRHAGAQTPARPEILDAGYPRAFFFRSSEGMAARGMPYERWEKIFSPLDGIMGKTLEEEVPGRSVHNIDYFTRFKKARPEQLVMLHFNGNARDPRWRGERFFAGHWLYYNGCRVLDPLPAAGGQAMIRVQNPRLFKVNTGRYQNSAEDLAICALTADGTPDWTRCEQVRLLAIDVPGKTITVERGQYGSRPLAFPAGRTYVAAHASEGPWGKDSHLIWAYNLASTCPRDPQGRSYADLFVEEIKGWFAPGGPLAAFDGVSFDVSFFDKSANAGRGGRGIDADGDGQRDDGIIDGINVYGLGNTLFYAALRQALGEHKIIQADGMMPRNQRAFGILNGIESEGFPSLNDYEIVDWSGGLNRHFAWRAAAKKPVFNYINHKFMTRGGESRPEVPFNIHRLVFAAGVFTDSAICYSYLPPGASRDIVPIWDELVMGAGRREHWLGKPQGEVVRLGLQTPDLLKGTGLKWEAASGTASAGADGETRLAGGNGPAGPVKATLGPIDLPAGDLLVYFKIRGAARAGYPATVPRLAWLSIATVEKKPLSPLTPERIMTWVGEKPLLSGFYFRDAGPARVTLTLEVEGGEPVYLDEVTVHNAPDAMARRFEHGLVLANPSTRPFEFDLKALAPGAALRRLRGTPQQDPKTNSGEAVGDKVAVPPRDALFLARDGR